MTIMSKWERFKAKSNWHFDTKKDPEMGKDSFWFVHRFDLDFSRDIEECAKRTQPSRLLETTHFPNHTPENPSQQYLEEKLDLDRANVDASRIAYEKVSVNDIENFKKIEEYLGLEESTMRFHNQRPGQLVMEHVDSFSGLAAIRDFSKDPSIVRRFIIFLDDWHLGQLLTFGNATVTRWKKGDCITWEWQDIPHSTANTGWNDRPILQITGFVTDKTRALLEESIARCK